MPRVHTVKKARKAQGQCGKCRCEIQPGDGYRHWSFRYGGKRIRCTKPECAPKRSELTQSWYLSQLYDIQDAPIDDSDLEAARDELVLQLEELRDECQERIDSMPEQLQYAPTGEMIQERIDSIECAIDELEALDIDQDCAPEDKREPEEVSDDMVDILSNIC